VWQAMAVSFFSIGGLVAGGVVWTTLLQRTVPKEMIGRVSSLDWLLSAGLTPLSYALTGPVSNLLGVKATLIGSGLAATSVLVLVLVFVPGLRASREQREAAVAA
jgi:hypothetical protein